jgi:septum formation protein
VSERRSDPGELVLASASPRRIAMLRAAGIRFRAVDSRIDERPPVRLGPLRLAEWAAKAKASAVAARVPNAVVVGADTVVALDGRTFGKPRDQQQAVEFLRALSGRTHQVYTAIFVVDRRRRRSAHGVSRTSVTMRDLSEAAIAEYVRTGEVQDKAGAYAIQGEGRRLVESIRGPYDNVVGMPMRLLVRLLGECGVPLPTVNLDRSQHFVHEGIPRRESATVEASKRASPRPASRQVRA